MNAKKLRILLVDNDADGRKHLQRMLSGAAIGCFVVDAGSVSKAVDNNQENTFDCIFLRFQMPEKVGLTALRTFRNQWPGAAIIVITGQGDEKIASEAIKAGAVDHIAKHDITVTSIARIMRTGLSIMDLRRELDEQRRGMESFAHVLVHDLAAPIASIRLLAMFIDENISESNFELLREDVSRITQSADRMGALIKSVKSYLEMGGDLAPVMLSTTSIVQGVADDLQVAIENSGAEVVFDTLPQIHGDPAQLTQLFQNLVSNAMKFCGDHPPRIVIDVKTDSDGSHWLVSVSDNGIGMADGSTQRVFGAFARLNDTDAYPGSGLGLAICHRIVSRHGGEIWCESNEGEGTTFFFTLPRPNTDSGSLIAA